MIALFFDFIQLIFYLSYCLLVAISIVTIISMIYVSIFDDWEG